VYENLRRQRRGKWAHSKGEDRGAVQKISDSAAANKGAYGGKIKRESRSPGDGRGERRVRGETRRLFGLTRGGREQKCLLRRNKKEEVKKRDANYSRNAYTNRR